MNNFLSIFKSNVSVLKAKGNSIVDVFTKTITDLKAVNSDIEKAQTERQVKIEIIIAEQEELSAIHSQNSKVIDKLNLIMKDKIFKA
jgi:hypothetical protein